MKWNTAIKIIEQAERNGETVSIEYHRKWMKNSTRYGVVDTITEYEYNGEICKAVVTFSDGLDESSHIIDDIEIL